jgi:shikimate kinase
VIAEADLGLIRFRGHLPSRWANHDARVRRSHRCCRAERHSRMHHAALRRGSPHCRDRSSPGGAATRNGTPNATLLCSRSIDPGRIERCAKNAQNVSITLIGPGGAGKSTVGVLIAKQLGIAFVDLDQRFGTRAGDISQYIDRFGYTAYARENVETYDSLLHEGRGRSVTALSSGFMTYPRDIHPQYARLRQYMEENPMTFMLIPSLNRDICVAETVRRQLARPFARSAEREEVVIRERFAIYVGLRARKIETMGTVTAVVSELLMALREAKVNPTLRHKSLKAQANVAVMEAGDPTANPFSQLASASSTTVNGNSK